MYIRSLFVAQIFVDGNSLKDCIVAVVVPDEPYLVQYCEQNGIKGSFKELCKNTVSEIVFFNY
jgi:long-chain acyl-CoA synthetase